tara:strand:- start:195 stop:809 length:615 start_codon:yes stop_codon:yes gene_type:complete
MNRKKKLRFIQVILLLTGITAIYLTYYNNENIENEKIISSQVKEKFNKQNNNETQDGDVFFNIEYTGLDLSGNRYLLKSEEAVVDKNNPEIIHMKIVNAVFYFKDDTTLYISSHEGFYNNKNFDMEFRKNVQANYLNSKLFADKAFYSNSESFLSISDNVRLDDKRGNLIADKLLFDIRSKKLDISSFKNGSVNANVKINEKRF